MSYLVDTNIISEMVKASPNTSVIDFLNGSRFLLPSLVFAELAYGIERLDAASKERIKYTVFIEKLRLQYHDVVVPLSMEMAELSGRLRAVQEKRGRVLSFADAVIAATAILTSSTLVTRNLKDFVDLHIPLLNPFAG